MSLHFYLGSSGAGKSYQMYHKIIQDSIENPKLSYFVLVPEQFTLQTQKDFVIMHPNKGIINIDVLSFLRLAFRIFAEVGGDNRLILEDTGKSMIVKKILLEKRDELILYGANVGKEGFVDEIKSLISEFYQYSIGPLQLKEMAELSQGRPLLSRKMKDLRVICEAFENFLKDKYITNEEILDVLCEVIGKSKLIKNSVICLDGYTGFTPSQYKLLSHLIGEGRELHIALTIDAGDTNRELKEYELFYLTYHTRERLKKIAEEQGVSMITHVLSGTPYRFRGNEALAALERSLFRPRKRGYSGETDKIQIYAARDPASEAVYTASKIKQLLRELGLRYRDIAVVTGDIGQYGALLRREFERAKIPCFLDDNRSILGSPLVALLRGAIAVAEEDFSFDAVFCLLKCGLYPFQADEIESLENYCLALGIRGHFRWNKEWTRTYRTRHRLDLEELNTLRERFLTDITPLYEVLRDQKRNVREHMTALYQFMLDLKAEERMFDFAEYFRNHPDANRRGKAQEYDQIYRIVIEVMDRIVDLLGEDVMCLREVRQILETGFREAKLKLVPPGLDQVMVGDIERTRLKDIKALFFVGVNDGIIPNQTMGGGIFTEVERQLFLSNQIELSPTRRQNAYTAEFYLYLSLTKPKLYLSLSYSRVDAEGKPLRPSYLIERIRRLFPELLTKTEPVFGEEQSPEEVLATDTGLSYLIRALCTYPENELNQASRLLLQKYQKEHQSTGEWGKLLSAAFYRNEERSLTKEAAKRLYGDILAGSVSRMEKYASCAFAHFLDYGLKLEERKEYQIGATEIGSLYHKVMEIFGGKLKEQGLKWHELNEELREELGLISVEEAVHEYGNGVFENTKRDAYLLSRLSRTISRTLKTLEEQIKAGEFEPEFYEQAFFHADQYLQLKGTIDRLDLYREEEKTYLRVIDYKSGNTSFDFPMLYYGLQLQLGVYLNAGMQIMRAQNYKSLVIPSGILYYNIFNPIVEKSDHVEQDIKKALIMDGLVMPEKKVLALHDKCFIEEDGSPAASVKSNVIPVAINKDGSIAAHSSVATGEQFCLLSDFLQKKLEVMGGEILDGRVEANPYQAGSRTACDYCAYSSICGFDIKLDGFDYRKFKNISKDEVWKRMEEEVRGGKDE